MSALNKEPRISWAAASFIALIVLAIMAWVFDPPAWVKDRYTGRLQSRYSPLGGRSGRTETVLVVLPNGGVVPARMSSEDAAAFPIGTPVNLVELDSLLFRHRSYAVEGVASGL